MTAAVSAGAQMTTWRKFTRSEIIPKSGLNRDGRRKKTVREPASVIDRPNLAMRRGRNGAVKLEKTSCTKCPPDMIASFFV